MNKNILILPFIFFAIQTYGQTEKTDPKFSLGVGVEYRLTPLKDIEPAGNKYFLNLPTNLTGVPACFSLAYHINNNWQAGYQYCIRYDYVGIKDDEFHGDYQIKDIKSDFISDYKLYVERFFYFKNHTKASVRFGYAFMNNGFSISVFENNQFHIYKFRLQALNLETNYHYKFFRIGAGIYYNPKKTHTNITGELQLLYFNIGFNVLNF